MLNLLSTKGNLDLLQDVTVKLSLLLRLLLPFQ